MRVILSEIRRAADTKTKMPPSEWPMVVGKCAEVELMEQRWKGADWANLHQLTLGHLDLRTVMAKLASYQPIYLVHTVQM